MTLKNQFGFKKYSSLVDSPRTRRHVGWVTRVTNDHIEHVKIKWPHLKNVIRIGDYLMLLESGAVQRMTPKEFNEWFPNPTIF